MEKKNLTLKDVKISLDICQSTLQKYYDDIANNDTPNERTIKLRDSYFKWIDLKTKLIKNEQNIKIPDGITIKRGTVFWVEFGYNIGEEFGGRHPAVILRKGGNTAIVLPISTKEPTSEQIKSGNYVEIHKIYNFKDTRRWVNILNLCPISISRFCFNSNIGNVKGYEMDNINKALQNSFGKNNI